MALAWRRGRARRNGIMALARGCLLCGKPFLIPPSRAEKAKFCSQSCRATRLGTKHGDCKTHLYTAWTSMKQRCLNPKCHAYAKYGARGIGVCKEWASSYLAFREWALAHGYSQGLEIDRIDNAKGYCPDNCRWATRVQQVANIGKRRIGATSRFKCVYWNARKRTWVVQAVCHGKRRCIYGFRSEEDAARAYDVIAKEAHGQFAFLNFKE
jgi:hypothetical protein